MAEEELGLASGEQNSGVPLQNETQNIVINTLI